MGFNPLADALIEKDIGNELKIWIKEELSEGEFQQIQKFYWGLMASEKGRNLINAVSAGETNPEEIAERLDFDFVQKQQLVFIQAGLKQWNLENGKGKPLDITEENILALKRSVFQAIAEACTQQYSMDDEQKNS